jgi:hypothetical protein
MAYENVNKTLANELTSNIGQRLFAYTYYGDVINENIANQFKRSLIFLGYEGQIWSPLTNTYVGIGKTSYTNAITYTAEAHAKIDALNTALTSSMVSNIYANWDVADWKDAEGTNDIDEKYLAKIAATNDIVLRGVGNYDVTTNSRLTYEQAHVTDVNAGKEGIGSTVTQDKLNAAKKVFTDVNQWADSGITVSLTKGRNWYRIERIATDEEAKTGGPKVAAWVEGFPVEEGGYWKDENGVTTSYTAAAVATETAYAIAKDTQGEHIFKNGKNIMTIDDKQTWSYISAKTSYAMEFAKHYTTTEVNRIYAEILGLQKNESIIPVSYAQIHQLTENGSAKVSVDADEYQLKEIGTDNIYLRKVMAPWAGGAAPEVTGEGNDAKITVDGVDYITIPALMALTTEERKAVKFVLAPDTNMGKAITKITDAQVVQDPEGSSDDNADGTITSDSSVSIYNFNYVFEVIHNIVGNASFKDGEQYFVVNDDYDPSSPSGINLADGINTLKEVAEVLDLITNGALNPNDPENSGIELAYSIAQNHIDIINLDNRVDKLEAGENAVRSLSNTGDGEHIDLTLTSGVDKDGKYYQDVNIRADLNFAYTTADSVDRENAKVISAPIVDETTGDTHYTIDSTGETRSKLVNRSHNGIVLTDWALSYGAELRDAIVNTDLMDVRLDAYNYTHAVVDALDGSYTSVNSRILTGFTQTNGKVTVVDRELPTDTLVATAEVWGETGAATAKGYEEVTELDESILRETPLYVADGNIYVKATADANGVVTIVEGTTYYKRTGDTTFVVAENDDRMHNGWGRNHKNYVELYVASTRYIRIDSADIELAEGGKTGSIKIGGTTYNTFYKLNTTPADQVKYISATSVHHTAADHTENEGRNDGGNTMTVTAHITKIADATASNSGLVDAYDVRNTLNHMFEWVDLSEWAASQNPMNVTDTVRS